MKFYYSLLKKLVPGIPSKEKFADVINLKAFEVEEATGNSMEIKITPNRFADAASHWGMALEAAAIFNLKTKLDDKPLNIPKGKGKVRVVVENKHACPVYVAHYLEVVKIGETPAWIKSVLEDCGLRPINPVVDIMNYVMLETGQPLHAFDADKLDGSIVVRFAKQGEKIVSLDNHSYTLTKEDLVIADKSGALAIAGIKGGKRAEVDKNTKRIIVEAANFNQANIYKTMKRIALQTDASMRFSRGLSPYSASIGANRASGLLKEVIKAKVVDSLVVAGKLPGKEIIEFNTDKFNSLIGLSLGKKQAADYLKSLGFKIITKALKNKNSFLVEVPPLRQDVTIFEDLAEEVVRLYGVNDLKPTPPLVGLVPVESDDIVNLKKELRTILVGFGFSEVYNYSFVDKKEADSLELMNPIAEDKKYLRVSLSHGLKSNITLNAREFATLRIFEIGKVFSTKNEEARFALGVKEPEAMLHLKGIISQLLKRLGLTDILMKDESNNSLTIKSDGVVLGVAHSLNSNSAIAELNLDALLKIVIAENEYRPLSKYPSISRDISLVVPRDIKVGQVLEVIDDVNLNHIQNVDLIDYFDNFEDDKSRLSLTFRLVFRSEEKTLTDEEVDKEFKKVEAALVSKIRAVIR